MPHYLIARIDIHDRAGYARYEAGFMEIFARYDGRMLAVDESPLVLEGEWPHTRTVLIEFPDAASAMRWYRSDDYQALAQLRFGASDACIVLIRGLD